MMLVIIKQQYMIFWKENEEKTQKTRKGTI